MLYQIHFFNIAFISVYFIHALQYCFWGRKENSTLIFLWFILKDDFQNGEEVDLYSSLALVFLPPLLSLWDPTGIGSLSELVDVVDIKKTGIQTNEKEKFWLTLTAMAE